MVCVRHVAGCYRLTGLRRYFIYNLSLVRSVHEYDCESRPWISDMTQGEGILSEELQMGIVDFKGKEVNLMKQMCYEYGYYFAGKTL